MTLEELNKKLKQLDIEDFIWVIYMFIIFMSWYSNSLERKYFLYKDKKCKEQYQEIMIIIFIILFIVYLYFLKSSYDDIKNLKNNDSSKKKELAYAAFIASLLIAVSGALFLYIAIEDKNLDVELAFN